MKILAIERDLTTTNWDKECQTLVDEAKAVYQMLLSGSVREIYFSENKNAVLILETEDKTSAKLLLNKLPLVEKGLVEFDITELKPYDGFSRLME